MTQRVKHTTLQIIIGAFFVLSFIFMYTQTQIQAAPLTSPNYRLDAQVMNNFGGQSASGSYALLGSGGEAVVGNGAGGSYKLGVGYVPQTERSIELNLVEGGLVARYPFNTGTGIIAPDVSGSSNDMALSAGSAMPTWAPGGRIGGALQFDGADSVAAPHTTDHALQEFSVSAWVRSDANTPGLSYIARRETSASNRNFALYRNAENRIGASTSFNGAQQDTSLSDPLTLGQWYHVVYTVGDGSQRIYINGVKVVEQSYSGSVDTQVTQTVMGSGVNGLIDEVRIYNKALTERDVSWHYFAQALGVSTAVMIPEVVPGESQSASLGAIVRTDFGGYDISIMQSGDLAYFGEGATTISSINNGGTIAAPAAWDEGATVGLGFGISDGFGVDPKWGVAPSSPRYAALPSAATSFFGKSGLSGGVKEVTSLEFRLDVPDSQKAGQYFNLVTITATARP